METACLKHNAVLACDKKIDTRKLICSSIDANNNKFWTGTIYESGSDYKVLVHYGRVGDHGTEETRVFSSKNSSLDYLNKKVKEKLGPRKGKESYSEAKTIETDIPIMRANDTPNSSLAMHAKLMAKNPATENLINHLVKVNVHNIISNTSNVTYNSTTGLFSTPLGIITSDGITEARDILAQIGEHVAAKNPWTDSGFIKLLNNYLRIIPQKVGRKLDPSTLYPDLESVQKQNDILDSLSGSLDVAMKPSSVPDAKAAPVKNVFEVTLELLEDKDEIARIRTKFQDSRDKSHTSAGLDIHAVYSIEIGPVARQFEKKGRPLGNVMELWHGSRPGNVLSIMKKGLVIPPTNAAHCTGRLFSNGVYGSDISTKALNYASPDGWGKGFGSGSTFMFLCEFAMGKVYYATEKDKWRNNLPGTGYDSTWAKGELQFPKDHAGVRHNEMIVPGVNQVNLTRLIEFRPSDKGRNW